MARSIRNRHLRRLLAALVLAVLSCTLAACGATANDTRSATAGLPNLVQQLTANEWVLDGAASTPLISGSHQITAVFTEDKHLSGHAACNRYHGSFSVDDETLTIGHLAQTLRACADPEAGVAEHRYLSALQAVTGAAPSSRDQLKLVGPHGIRLVFHAVLPSAG